MKMITDKEYKDKLANLRKQNEIIQMKNELKQEKNKYKKKMSASKLLLLVVVFMCLEIIVFSQYAMMAFQDLTALYTLIGVPVTIVPVALGYYYKSKAENTENGITYELAMREADENQYTEDINNMTSEGEEE